MLLNETSTKCVIYNKYSTSVCVFCTCIPRSIHKNINKYLYNLQSYGSEEFGAFMIFYIETLRLL